MQEDGRIFWRPTEPDIDERFRWLRNHRQWGSPGWSMVPELAARVARVAKTYAGRNILELGTSRGFLSAILAASGCFVTTVDKADRGASANLQDLPVRCVHSPAAAYLRTQTSVFALIVVDVHDNNERMWQELWPLLPDALESDGLLVLYNSHLWQIPGREDESGLRWMVDNPPAGWSTEVFAEPLPGMILCRRV
jgi:predicted O-methyltransferase YrrM